MFVWILIGFGIFSVIVSTLTVLGACRISARASMYDQGQPSEESPLISRFVVDEPIIGQSEMVLRRLRTVDG